MSLIDQEADRSYTSLSQTISRSDRSTSMLIVAEIEDEPETRQFNFFNSYDIIEDITADHVAAEFLNDLVSIEAPTYDLQYVGKYEQYEDVYKMVIRNREEENQSENTLYMIYEDFQWQVIGVNGEI